uniref:H15 domain-containing protein n=1 Tax=Acanthochromis polyacanthus TaxID=80966 RepID=A0A3Q1FSK8_9TELE
RSSSNSSSICFPAKAAKKKASKHRKTVAASKEQRNVTAGGLKKALAAGGYNVDKNKAHIKTGIKMMVTKGALVQISGSGASSSFKINKKQAHSKAKKSTKKVTAKAKKSNTATAKKPLAIKKSPKKAKKPAAAKKAALQHSNSSKVL